MFKSNTGPSNSESLEDKVHCSVSFFNTAKGYSFVEVSKDEADVSLHLHTMRNFRIYYLDKGRNLSLEIIEYGCLP